MLIGCHSWPHRGALCVGKVIVVASYTQRRSVVWKGGGILASRTEDDLCV